MKNLLAASKCRTPFSDSPISDSPISLPIAIGIRIQNYPLVRCEIKLFALHTPSPISPAARPSSGGRASHLRLSDLLAKLRDLRSFMYIYFEIYLNLM